MENGFIYPVANWIIQLINKFSAVEYFKNFIAWAYGRKRKKKLKLPEVIKAKNFAIDLFITLKWALIIVLMLSHNDSIFARVLVYYLIFFNLFTYFYYHSWGSNHATQLTQDAQRRRFVNFLLSIAFYIFCYAYLYNIQVHSHITWPEGSPNLVDSIHLSFANAFTLTYGDFFPLNQYARILFLTELVNTFFFFTIIVANSIPSTNNAK